MKMTEKICQKCSETKPIGDFHRNKSKTNGVHEMCKKCRSEYRKQSGEYKKNQYYVIRHRANKAGVENTLTIDEYNEIISTPECAYCGKPTANEFEHVTPTSKKGPNSVGNAVHSCRSCNMLKNRYDLVTFYEKSPDFTFERLQALVDRYLAENGPTATIYSLTFGVCKDYRQRGC
jgi:5-methylcytosine-specific restriction endonuclease McrA